LRFSCHPKSFIVTFRYFDRSEIALAQRRT